MKYEEWLRTVPQEIMGDSLWNMQVYRQALFLGDLAWRDAIKISRMGRWRQLSDQLYRAVGSISANISEGYSYPESKDEFRFYRYALGSAREARDWYFKSRHVLEDKVTQHRLKVLEDILRQLIYLVTNRPRHSIKENQESYLMEIQSDNDVFSADIPFSD